MKIDTNVRRISDDLLLSQTEFMALQERETTIVILRHLREIEVRRLYIELGYSSMHKYCIQKLKYSEGQAYRRIASARLLTELPEIEKQIQSGDLNLTNLSKIQSFVRTEKAAHGEMDKTEKLNLIESLENKSTREVERELVKKSHQPLLMAEKFRMTGHELSQVQEEQGQPEVQYQRFETLLNGEQQNLLQEFKNFYAHELTDMSNHMVLMFLLEKAVNHKRKKHGLQTKPNNNAPLPSAPEVKKMAGHSSPKLTESSFDGGPSDETSLRASKSSLKRRPLKADVKRSIWQRAGGCCEHIHSKTKERCSSKFALEEDHIHPIALGGNNDLGNIQLLCRAHNSRRAIKTFGAFRPQR